MEVSTSELRIAVEKMHGCVATWNRSVRVKETFKEQTVWEGVVQVFKVSEHPSATMCYAWSYVTDGGKRKYIAVLHQDPVKVAG